ncbi:MAG: mandelate racemase/muconate lactonizing enzyme family protein [Pseudomonadota bacterium]
MNINSLTTFTSPKYPHLMWVEVESSDGFKGVGETYYWPEASSSYVHEAIAPILMDGSSLCVEKLVQLFLRNRLTSGRMSLETRAFSAVECALVDIEAQRAGSCLGGFLGGTVRDKIRVYNTGGSRLSFAELEAFLSNLKSQGVNAFKITPYHQYVEETSGAYISRRDLEEARSSLFEIRDSLGPDADLMIEMGCRWQPYAARQIMQSIKDLQVLWVEDPIVVDSPQTLGDLRRECGVPLAVSEYTATIHGLTEYYRQGAVDVVMIDVGWVGGIMEARKVATIAEQHRRPVTFHDFTGPLAYILGAHMSCVTPNAFIQESATDFYSTWYLDVVDTLPDLSSGYVSPPRGKGIGVQFTEKFRSDANTQTRTSSVKSTGGSRWQTLDALGYIFAESNLLHLDRPAKT